MSLWAVVREAGPAWSPGGIYDQVDGDAHAVFMNGLADEGFVRFGGPLAGTQDGRVRVLLVVDAGDEAEIRRRLAEDPWEPDRLRTVSVEPWLILVGAPPL
jgi:hypothetical protein